MNVTETRNPSAPQPPQVQRAYTMFIDASNWATATEAAGVCFVGQQDTKPSCCGGGPQWGHAWTCPQCPD